MAWFGVERSKVKGHRVNKCIFTLMSEHNSKTNDPKVFKIDIANELGDILEVTCFGVERSKVKVIRSIIMTITPV